MRTGKINTGYFHGYGRYRRLDFYVENRDGNVNVKSGKQSHG
jgi:hypothetical protein